MLTRHYKYVPPVVSLTCLYCGASANGCEIMAFHAGWHWCGFPTSRIACCPACVSGQWFDWRGRIEAKKKEAVVAIKAGALTV